MWRWTLRATLGVIGLAGVVTVLLFYLILGYGSGGLLYEQVEPSQLAWSALPTALFLAASLIRRKSLGMQRLVAAAAVVVAVLIGGTICYELSQPFQVSPVTGTLSMLAWVAGSVGAGMVLLVAAGAAFWDWFRRKYSLQFGIRALLIAVAFCAVIFTMGRWLWHYIYYGPQMEVFVQTTRDMGAMEPTISDRAIIVADIHAYRRAKPARWEVVVFRPPENPATVWVFRVVGLPRETVSFSEGKIVIDGQPVVPPTHLQNVRFHCDLPDVEFVPHPYTVPDGCYYLLGDNPEKAHDSRLWGALPEAEILGRVPRD